jgi:hypothetical protein
MSTYTTPLIGRLKALPGVRFMRRPCRRLKNYNTPEATNTRGLRALAGRHRGRRGVAIGNGPSLRVEDLDRLRGGITFASNKIFLAFDQVAWRPTFHSCSDILVAKNNREAINGLRPGETWTMPRLDKQLEAFISAKEAFERNGGQVYNASRFTKLEVFPRVSFDDVFPPK